MSQSVKFASLRDGEMWVQANRTLYNSPGIILLSGPFGAGKTQLVSWILKQLGSSQGSSPTFAIHHQYQTLKRTVDHFDLYRLKGDDELESCGFWDAVGESDNLVIIEWADRLPVDAFPKNRRTVSIQVEFSGSERTLTVL